MLLLKTIQSGKDLIIERLKIRNLNVENQINKVFLLDINRKKIQQQLDTAQFELKKLSGQIGMFYQQGNNASAEAAKQQTGIVKQNIAALSEKHTACLKEIEQILHDIPNLPHPSVPAGKGEQDNVVEKEGGAIPELGDEILPHWELTKKYDIIDFELGNKITGTGFPLYKGKGAALQRALINFFLQENIKTGYTEVFTPLMVNETSGFGTGQLPDKEGQMYHIASDNLYLIPTAEVSVTNIYRDVILNENDLPQKITAFSSCFRREAGSYGKNVRGLNRLHQFEKVEIVQITHPENSYKALEEMVAHVEALIQKLELPYRIVRLCGGDLGFTSALTFDFEVYSAAQRRWLEVSSVSNFETFQANRLKLRFRNKQGKTELAHTLNGSALALPRIVAALLENNQTSEGIAIPKALHKFTGFKMII